MRGRAPWGCRPKWRSYARPEPGPGLLGQLQPGVGAARRRTQAAHRRGVQEGQRGHPELLRAPLASLAIGRSMGHRENLAARSLTADPWEGHGSPCPSPGLCPGGPTERPAFLIHRPVGETQDTSPEAGGDVVLSSHAPPQSSLGRGRYSFGAGSRIGFVRRLYTASALAISFLRFGFSRSYCISSLILSLTAAGR